MAASAHRCCAALTVLCCMQITDVSSPDNSSMLDYTKHHSLEGIDVKTLRQRANRITAHTDESLITLLLHSPGECLPFVMHALHAVLTCRPS